MTSPMEYIKEKLNILTGNLPVPFDTSQRITNRSVTYPSIDQRELAVEFLSHELEALNVDFTIQRFTKNLKDDVTREIYEISFANVIADIPGTSDEKKTDLVVIGAHYDVQNSLSHCWKGRGDEDYVVTQGADDNGSGTICCLELVRRFKENPLSVPVRVVFFDGEEPGHFTRYLGYGSKYFCNMFNTQDETIRLAYTIDMIGGPLVDHRIGFTIGTANVVMDGLLRACDQVRDQFGYKFGISALEELDVMNATQLTDSAYFADMQVPTTMLSNLAGLKKLPSFYHTAEDTVEIIDWDSFLNAIDISEALIRREDWY